MVKFYFLKMRMMLSLPHVVKYIYIYSVEATREWNKDRFVPS